MTNPNRRPDATSRLEEALARIRSPEREGSKVFTAVYEESARREAEASDRRRAAGTMRGPLDGRIVSIKALFDLAGEPTSAGSALLRRRPPAAADAPVLVRLREAGAVIIGKTQMTEFAFSGLGTNPHDPEPGNPRDRTRVPGGSSSGAVVSVVEGMAEIAIGSDTGGSTRIPAALSGAVGFKPTAGRIPTAGAFSLSSSLDTIGPIALTVADCALADAVMAGAEPAPLAPVPPARLIVARGRLFADTEPAVQEAFEAGLESFPATPVLPSRTAVSSRSSTGWQRSMRSADFPRSKSGPRCATSASRTWTGWTRRPEFGSNSVLESRG